MQGQKLVPAGTYFVSITVGVNGQFFVPAGTDFMSSALGRGTKGWRWWTGAVPGSHPLRITARSRKFNETWGFVESEQDYFND
jgi:hypothetical protein